ncbi:MAG: hypothetical protein U5K29_11655 [Acidimicrobiales bacterium]|nr:hypothetical protein [Acidimicrobiales bacterium]
MGEGDPAAASMLRRYWPAVVVVVVTNAFVQELVERGIEFDVARSTAPSG